jgi:hypothetical protein
MTMSDLLLLLFAVHVAILSCLGGYMYGYRCHKRITMDLCRRHPTFSGKDMVKIIDFGT